MRLPFSWRFCDRASSSRCNCRSYTRNAVIITSMFNKTHHTGDLLRTTPLAVTFFSPANLVATVPAQLKKPVFAGRQFHRRVDRRGEGRAVQSDRQVVTEIARLEPRHTQLANIVGPMDRVIWALV